MPYEKEQQRVKHKTPRANPKEVSRKQHAQEEKEENCARKMPEHLSISKLLGNMSHINRSSCGEKLEFLSPLTTFFYTYTLACANLAITQSYTSIQQSAAW